MKTLSLLRHAAAASAADDHERPLSETGKKEAAAIAAQLAKACLLPDLILVSPARRALETAAAVAALAPSAQFDSDAMLYLAEPETLLDILTLCDDKTEHVLLVGHNPGIAELAFQLAGTDASRIGSFTPATLAVFSHSGDWADLHPSKTRLQQLLRP